MTSACRHWILLLLLAALAGDINAADPGPALPTNRKTDDYPSREVFLEAVARFETERLQRLPWRRDREESFFADDEQAISLTPGVELRFRRVEPGTYLDSLSSELKEQLLAVPNRRGDLRRWGDMFDLSRSDRVTVPYPFFMSETIITNAMFAAFVAETGYETTVARHRTGWVVTADAQWQQGVANHWRLQLSPLSSAEHPVVQISWFDAMAFAAWLSEKAGVIFRVPTLEEWTLAARAPALAEEICLFPWGNDFTSLGQRLNFGTAELSTYSWVHDQFRDGHAYSSPVRAYPPNDRGLYDMLGNVWVWNWTSRPDYDARPHGDRSARPGTLAELRVAHNGSLAMAGGCYLARITHTNLHAKMSHPALDGAEDIGFRVVAVRTADSGFISTANSPDE